MQKIGLLRKIIEKGDEGLTLFEYLKGHSQHSSRQLKQMIDQGKCHVNHQVITQGNYILLSGDIIEAVFDDCSGIDFEKSRILFENDEFLAYNKPAGLVCSDQGISCLKSYHPDLRLIHRLDRYTTGVLLLAKNKEALNRFINLFKKRKVKKTYQALVEGEFSQASGVIHNRLGKLKEVGGKAVWGEVEGGLEAITEWEVLGSRAGITRLQCYPVTGRTHQIRVHLAGIGHPIVGDHLYGSHRKESHYLLHSWKVQFDVYEILAPLPKTFE